MTPAGRRRLSFHAELKEAGMLRPELSRSLLAAPLAALVIALAPAAASAGEPAAQQKIRISDFDLNKHDDVVRLYKYISTTAARVCDQEPLTGTLLPSANQQACVKQAIENTVAKINKEQLTAYHQQETNSAKLAERSGAGGKSTKPGATYSDHN
jgi:UrcA family protein